ncbi:MAG: cyclic nucleotide-binding domain-containing protein [Epsilonproteobacteria bacterium]|nr:cyclic nucleotide-binding domain-containing protein [Campylobacterota bacterium]
MREHSLFKDLTDEEYHKLIKIFKKRKIPANTTIIKEGEYGESAFLLIEGKIAVVKETIYGEDYVVTIIEAGGDEFFSEINLIDRGKRTSTIRTIEESVILEVTSSDIKEFMDNHPVIGYKIMWYMARSLAKHLRKADNDVITLFNALVEVVEND